MIEPMVVPIALTVMLAAGSAGSAGSTSVLQEETEHGAYEITGDDLTLYDVVDHFLHLAGVFYVDPEPVFWEEFCGRYNIDASWPSATALGRAGPRLEEEYLARINEAYRDRIDVPVDPNEWKPREVGRVFADLHGRLRSDGLTWDMRQFARLLEDKLSDSFVLMSDQPPGSERSVRSRELFLDGMADVSNEGAALATERRER